MTTKIMASFALAALASLTACGDSNSSTPPTKAQQCAAGVTSDCILGTWSLNGPTVPRTVDANVIYVIESSHDFTANPAKLRFYIDEKKANKFEFTNSPLSTADCKTTTGVTYGNWDIVGNALHLYANIGNECMAKNEITLTPEIKVEGAAITMTFKEIFFMEPEMKSEDAVETNNAIEIYSFVSAE